MTRFFCGEHCNEHGYCHFCGFTAGVLLTPTDKMSRNHEGHESRLQELMRHYAGLPVVVTPVPSMVVA